MGNSLVKERSSETMSSSNETTLVTSLFGKKDIICTSEDVDSKNMDAVDTYTLGCISIGGFFSGKSSGKGDNIVDIIPTATSVSTNSSETTTISTTSSLTNSDGLAEDSLSRPPESLSPKNLKWLQETITESEQSIIDLRKTNKSLSRELGKNYNPNDDDDNESPGQRQKGFLKKYLEVLEKGGITLKEDHLALVSKYVSLSTEEAALLEEERRLLRCKGKTLQEKTKKLEEESQRLDSKIEIRKIVRESKNEAIDREKSQIIQEECQKLKTETDSIQKRILDDLKDFELKQQHQQTQKSTNTNDTVTTGEEAELFETLETEMLRLHDEANGIRDDLDQKQIDFTDDLTKNYKLRKSWATKSQQSKGLTLKVKQCFNKKRADLADWVDRSFIECGVCQKNLPMALGSSHLKFCSECSCHVCFRCDCEPFHLANQELALYATEEADQEKRISKKMKKKRKKGRKKENAKKNQVMNSQVSKDECGGDDDDNDSNVACSGIIDEISRDNNQKSNKSKDKKKSAQRSSSPTTVLSLIDDEERDDWHDDYEVRRNKKIFERKQLAEADKGAANNGIDFVTHLEETGSMIALSNLMNELEGKGVDLDEGHEGVASFQDTVQRSVLKEIKSNGVWYI